MTKKKIPPKPPGDGWTLIEGGTWFKFKSTGPMPQAAYDLVGRLMNEPPKDKDGHAS